MDVFIISATFFYLLSSAGYIAYLVKQRPYQHRTGLGLMIAGFVCHTIALGHGVVVTRHLPVHNLHETLVIAGGSVAGVFIILQCRFRMRILGVYAAPLVALTAVAAILLPGRPVPADLVFRNVWFVFHILSTFLGEATFALAAGVGMMYLLQEKAIKTRSPGFFFRRLPSLDLLDTTGYACIITGFTMLTIGLITGMIYAKSVWGAFWSWDPKEVWSAISWLLYAALLHQRITLGFRGRRAATMAIIGFTVLLFTFFGVNFLLQGHHNEFTRW